MEKDFVTRVTAGMLSVLMVAGAATACGSKASAADDSAAAKTVSVRVNSSIVQFPDIQPYINEDQRTLIPVRGVTEALGAKVSYDSKQRAAVISLNGVTETLPIGSDQMTVEKDGETSAVTLDSPAILKDNTRTMVPIRAVAENLGCYVDYSNLYATVQIFDLGGLTRDEMTQLRNSKMHYASNFDQFPVDTGEDADVMNQAVLDPTFGAANASEYALRHDFYPDHAEKNLPDALHLAKDEAVLGRFYPCTTPYKWTDSMEVYNKTAMPYWIADVEDLYTCKNLCHSTFSSNEGMLLQNSDGKYIYGILRVTVDDNATQENIQKFLCKSGSSSAYDFCDIQNSYHTVESYGYDHMTGCARFTSNECLQDTWQPGQTYTFPVRVYLHASGKGCSYVMPGGVFKATAK